MNMHLEIHMFLIIYQKKKFERIRIILNVENKIIDIKKHIHIY